MSGDDDNVFQIAESSARGGYYLFVGNTLSTIIMLAVSIIIARFLGPDNYALYSLVLSIPSLFIGLVDFGVTFAITRFTADFKAVGRTSDVKHVINSGIIFELVVGLIASIFCFVFSDFLATYLINAPDAGFYVKAASFLVLFQTLFNTLSFAFMGLDVMKNNAVMMLLRAIAKFLLSIFLLFLGFSVLGALLGHVLCYLVATGAGLTLLTYKLRKNHDEPTATSWSIFKLMLKYGVPLYISSIMGLFLYQYQTILIAYLTSKTAIGNFQVITLFSTAMAVLIYPLTALFPAFSKFDKNSKQLNQFFRRSVKYTALLLVPASVAIAVMSKDLVFAFFGSDYALAPTFLAFFILTYVYSGFGTAVLGYLFNGLGKTDVTLKYVLVNLLVFVPLAPLFINSFGIMGLIAASFVSGFCSLLYGLLTAIKKFNVSVDFLSSTKIFLCSAISALLSLVFLIYSPFNNVINIIVGFTVFLVAYLTLLPAIGVLNSTDLEIFRRLFQKTKSVWPIIKLFLAYEAKILKIKQKAAQ